MPSADLPTFQVQQITMPGFVYGTAWKEDQTADCVIKAIKAGFRSIDTANQRKHYHEAGVGEGLRVAFEGDSLKRSDLFLQSKFTYRTGQDHRLPYDPTASLTDQVRQSLSSTLDHLGIEQLDSLVIHGPASSRGLSTADKEVWRTFEALHGEGKVRLIGVSNMEAEQIRALCDFATVPPALAQIRTFAQLGWNAEIRSTCRELGLVYQGFNLITANRQYLAHPAIKDVASKYNKTSAQVIFRFCLQIGIQPMSGTTNTQHMKECLDLGDFELNDQELGDIERVAC